MKHSGMYLVLLALLGAMALGAPGVGAQEGDPATRCELEPLELPLFGGTPVAEVSTPAGEPVDDVSAEEIEGVLDQYVACTNTGDPTLVWAMFSPRWFSTTFADSEEHYLPAFEQDLDDPAEVAANPLELVEVVEIVTLDDGRVDVTATFRSGDEQWTDTLTLVAIDGVWRIDEVRMDTGAD